MKARVMRNVNTQFWAGFGIAALALAGLTSYAYFGEKLVRDTNPPENIIIDDTPTAPIATVPGEPITLVGTLTCLPHKGDGPHTLECAYGLKADDGNHYALKNLFTEPGPWPLDIGDRVRVTGTLDDPERNEKYDIVGVMEVQSSSKI